MYLTTSVLRGHNEDISTYSFIAISNNAHRNDGNPTDKVGMLSKIWLMANWKPGSHKVLWFYSVSAAVSSTTQSMSDQSGEVWH